MMHRVPAHTRRRATFARERERGRESRRVIKYYFISANIYDRTYVRTYVRMYVCIFVARHVVDRSGARCVRDNNEIGASMYLRCHSRRHYIYLWTRLSYRILRLAYFAYNLS